MCSIHCKHATMRSDPTRPRHQSATHPNCCSVKLTMVVFMSILLNSILCVYGVHACLCLSSLANRSAHAAQWNSSCVLWRADGPGWVWRSSWRGSVATSRVPLGRRKKASASGVAAKRTHPLAVTHLLKKTISAVHRYLMSCYMDTKAKQWQDTI